MRGQFAAVAYMRLSDGRVVRHPPTPDRSYSPNGSRGVGHSGLMAQARRWSLAQWADRRLSGDGGLTRPGARACPGGLGVSLAAESDIVVIAHVMA
jgi:hypothetical protein